MPPAPPMNWSGIIPAEFSTQIIEEATAKSTVLTLGQRLPMGTSVTDLPIPKTLPKAAWVSAPGGRKAWTDVMLEAQSVHAEEVAAVTAIPDAFLEDSSINLWNWVRPRLSEAIAYAVDDAVLFGVAAPPTFPTGGIVADAYSTAVAPASALDAVDGVNRAMALVEAQGLAVSGHASDLTVKSILRGVRDSTGALLLGEGSTTAGQVPTLYGAPISYNPWSQTTAADLITGAWQYLIMGVRTDIRFVLDKSAVIADAAGAVVISGFQDNVTPLKAWMRLGCAIVRPVTPRVPAGAKPFSRIRLGQITAAADSDQVVVKRGPGAKA